MRSPLAGIPVLNNPGGMLTSTNEIGRTQHERFTVIPELGVNLTYRLTDALGLNVGYTVLYVDQALRAGEQVDRNFTTFTPIQQGIAGNFTGFDESLLAAFDIGDDDGRAPVGAFGIQGGED